ncbi:MAG: TetR/AcrR family transcriptional regulator [Solirubrobacteraceae bacterium]
MSAPDPARRSARARDAILAATRGLLSEVGFARLTIEAVAARAGVGKQTIYRWWPTKGAVVFDALLDGEAGSEGTHDLPDTGAIERDLRTVLRAIVEELGDPQTDHLQRTITAEIQHDRALADELVVRLLGPQMRATADRLRVAQEAGQIGADVDVELGVELLFGPLFHRWLLRTAPLDAAYADRIVRHALAGLRPRG